MRIYIICMGSSGFQHQIVDLYCLLPNFGLRHFPFLFLLDDSMHGIVNGHFLLFFFKQRAMHGGEARQDVAFLLPVGTVASFSLPAFVLHHHFKIQLLQTRYDEDMKIEWTHCLTVNGKTSPPVSHQSLMKATHSLLSPIPL